ncbi:hypothetical protein KC19_8G037200 [Ceratodon purpureus]|uniref:Uncharacterized protein n=1 Tax=Ceratodon purpureus TaxID=3225 RepID=A0A8T0GWV4_CERPU|nr:hypothetical protein KC19_8G037200 [Ceratodon purpureus]
MTVTLEDSRQTSRHCIGDNDCERAEIGRFRVSPLYHQIHRSPLAHLNVHDSFVMTHQDVIA